MVGGYEWAQIKRSNVTYEFDNLADFTQPTTVSNMVFVGVQEDWSPALSSFLRYRFTANSWPIVGVTERQTVEFRRGHQLESTRVRWPSRNGRHLERGRRFHAQWHILGRKQLQPLGVCQLLGDGLSVHPQRLVHTQCQVVARRRLCQLDKLDHPGHHAGARTTGGSGH